jgi:large subunit ribosomal protein L4
MVKGIELFGAEGNTQGQVDIKFNLLDEKISTKAYSCVINVLRQNWRQGTVSCKGRSDVAFSGKKPWRQKGTGRARAGTLSSPLWRKGGVIFGPQARSKKLKVTQKQSKKVLGNIFNFLYEQNKIKCLDLDLGKDKSFAKTKVASKSLKDMGIAGEKIVMFVNFNDSATFSSFRNLSNVNLMYFDQPNAFDLSSVSNWVFLKKDMDLFKEMVSKWN